MPKYQIDYMNISDILHKTIVNADSSEAAEEIVERKCHNVDRIISIKEFRTI
jgi:hypothetical protein